MIGRTFLHYTVTAELGAGAMGRVYLARDTRTERRVALKFLGADPSPDAYERLLREARAAARLSHPNIVALYGLEEADGQRFIVQEFVEGETLASRLGRGPLGTRETLRLARELAEGLAHAHANGVLHRDLKPDNVLVAADGRFKIADFGIARLEGAPTLTADGMLLGTLPYLAPERLTGHVGDARADLFSLGAILYEAMTGRRAFPGASEAAVVYAVTNEDPPQPENVQEALRPFVPMVMKLLSKQPSQRPASAEVVSGVLEGFEPPERATSTSASAPQPGSAPPTARRRGWVIPIVAALLLVLAGAGIWIGRLKSSAGISAAAAEPSVAVLYFENVSDPGDPGRIGPIAGNLLVTSFAQSPDLNVLSSQRILDAVRSVAGDGAQMNASLALQVARRAHAARIVTGKILQTSPALVMTAEIVDVASGRVLHAERIEGRPGQTVFQLVDDLSARLLAGMLHRDRASISLAPVAQRTSASLQAQRHLTEGQQWFARANFDSAEAHFAAAIRIDPGFAQAHYQRAIVQWWRHDFGGARQSLVHASQGADRLSPLEREMLPALEALVSSHPERAFVTLERLASRHPDDRLVQYGREEAAFHSGNDAQALEAGRAALAIDPDFGVAAVHVMDVLQRTGRIEEAAELGRDLVARLRESDTIKERLFRVFTGSDRMEEAIALATSGHDRKWTRDVVSVQLALYEMNRGNVDSAQTWARSMGLPGEGTRLMRYTAAIRQGRYREALRVSDEAWRAATLREGDLTGPAVPTIALGTLAAGFVGDDARALEGVDSLRTRLARWIGEDTAMGAESGKVYLLLDRGRLTSADSVVRAMEARVPAGRVDLERVVRYARALVLGAQGRGDEALEAFGRAQWWDGPYVGEAMTRFDRMRLLQGAGRHAEALASLDTLDRAPILWPEFAVRLPLVRAQSLEALGRIDEARRLVRAWLAARPRADRDLIDVIRARETLARLDRASASAAAGATPSRPGTH